MFQTQRASLVGKLVLSGSLCLMLFLISVAQAQTRVSTNMAATDPQPTATATTPARPKSGLRPASTVRGVSVTKEGGTLVATIELDGLATFDHFTLSNPLRVIVDIKDVRNGSRPMIEIGQQGIERARVAQREDHAVRVVFDRTNRQSYQIEAEGDHILVWFGPKPANRATASETPTVIKTSSETPASKTSTANKPPMTSNAASTPPPPAPISVSAPPKSAPVAPAQPRELPMPGKRNTQSWLKAMPPAMPPSAWSLNRNLAVANLNATLVSPPSPAPVNPPPPAPSSAATASSTPSNTTTNNVTTNKAATNKAATNNAATSSDPASNTRPRNTASTSSDQAAGALGTFKASDYSKPGFLGEAIKLELKGVDIRDILRFIGESYKVNFVVDKSVAPDTLVTVGIDGVPWNQALDALLRSNRLGIQIEGDILRVMSQSAITEEDDQRRKQLEARQLATPLITEMVRLNYARAVSGQSATSGAGAQISSAGGSGGSAGGGTQSGLDSVINSRLSARGKIQADPRTNTLVITDIPENIAIIKDIIAKLDVPEPQVEIEARIVIANRSFARDLGVQLGAVATNPSRNGLGAFSTMPNPPVPTNLPPALTGSGSSSSGTGGVFGAIGDTLRAVGASSVLGLTTGLSGTVQLSAILSAAENKGNIKTISTPRVSAQNNMTANIVNGVQIPVQTQSNNTVTTTFVTAALKLEITPQITDAGTVVLRVVAENNSVNLSLAALNPGGTPGINTQRAETSVLVPDGGTTIIGGINIDTETNAQQRTPGVSRIPGLGELFKRRTTSMSNDEILFFITPRIYRPLGLPGQTSEAKN